MPFFFFFGIICNDIKKKKGIQGGQSSLKTDSVTCGRLPLLKKKNSLDWTMYLAATWASCWIAASADLTKAQWKWN